MILMGATGEISFKLQQEEMKLNLRWNIFTNKDLVEFQKKGDSIFIKSLSSDFIDEMMKDLKQLPLDKKYISKVIYHDPTDNNVAHIEVKLSNPSVEMFTFYRDRENKYVLDFWIEESKESQKVVENEVVPPQIALKKEPASLVSKKKSVAPKKIERKVAQDVPKSPEYVSLPVTPGEYRDFRYGASFIWDYPGIVPDPSKEINLARKTPEFYYPILDRKLNDPSLNKKEKEKEAHLQLSINLYREKKWGLMYNSIELFQKKYGDNDNEDLHDYLKANALLKSNLLKGKLEPEKLAMNLLDNVASRTKDYGLFNAINKYLLAFYLEKKDFVRTLQISKKMYIESKKNFDYEETTRSAEIIFHSLAQLEQLDKIKELGQEKTIVKIVPLQTRFSYELYVNIARGEPKEVIKKFEANESSLAPPIDKSILYNVAESYFRNADYNNAIKYFDKFIANYSYHPIAAKARLRLALSYDLLDRPEAEVEKLYRLAIDRSPVFDVTMEAKLRYVALRNLRKYTPDNSDKEVRIFLDIDEKIKLDKNLTKLLWLVRMRLFMMDRNFEEGLAYLTAIPIDGLLPEEKRVFSSDGAEIIYGVLLHRFEKGDYARLIKIWEIYKDVYVDKVANDPFINYISGSSYIKLGLYEGFERIYQEYLKKKGSLPRTYPLWVDRPKDIDGNDLLVELSIIKNLKMSDWENAEKNIAQFELKNPNYKKLKYFKGILAYNGKNFKKAISLFEDFLTDDRKDPFNDPSEIADLLRKYAESIYQLNDLEKYKKVAEAILSDTKNFAKENPFMDEVKEKVAYMSIEILAGEKKEGPYMIMESKIKDFKKIFPKSIYIPRMEYLLGLAYVETQRIDKGKDIFNKILGDNNFSNILKELARSELTLLKMKEKQI